MAKIEFISQTDLASVCGMTKQNISYAVRVAKKLRNVASNGQTGIDIHDALTIAYVKEHCTKKGLPIPDIFKPKQSELSLFMEAVLFSLKSLFPEHYNDRVKQFKKSVIKYTKARE